MDANDLTPEDRDTLARASCDPVIREPLDFIGPMNLESTLRVARDLERVVPPFHGAEKRLGGATSVAGRYRIATRSASTSG